MSKKCMFCYIFSLYLKEERGRGRHFSSKGKEYFIKLNMTGLAGAKTEGFTEREESIWFREYPTR